MSVSSRWVGALTLVAAISLMAEATVGQQSPLSPSPRPAITDAGDLSIGTRVAPPSPAEARIREELAKPADFPTKETTLRGLADHIAEKHGIAVGIDVESLTAVGIGDDSTFLPRLGAGTLKSKLRARLHDYGMTYIVRDEQLVLISNSAAEVLYVPRVYQVHDLVAAPVDPTAPPDFTTLIDVIMAAIEPYSWIDLGGTYGNIKKLEAPGIMALVVVQTEEGHDQLESFLSDLRAAKSPDVVELQRLRLRATQEKTLQKPTTAPNPANAPDRPVPDARRSFVPPPKRPQLQAFIEANDHFACDIYPHLAAANGADRNFVFSPIGLNSAVGALYAGSTGATRDEIAAAMHYPPVSQASLRTRLLLDWLNDDADRRIFTLQSRNRVVVDRLERLPDPLQATLTRDFYARLIGLGDEDRDATLKQLSQDFGPPRPNDPRETDGFQETTGLVAGLDEHTRLAVINSNYFRGAWDCTFDSNRTYRAEFHSPGGILKVEMMVYDWIDAEHKVIDGIDVVRFPYQTAGSKSGPALFLLVPPEGAGELQRLESRFTVENLRKWTGKLDMARLDLRLPKFAFETLLDARPALEKLGIRRAFVPPAADGHHALFSVGADFPSVGGARNHSVQFIRQKSRIEVDVHGTTFRKQQPMWPIARSLAGGMPPRQTVRCDRPFLFFVRDEPLGTLLLVGRVTTPDNDPQAEFGTFKPQPF